MFIYYQVILTVFVPVKDETQTWVQFAPPSCVQQRVCVRLPCWVSRNLLSQCMNFIILLGEKRLCRWPNGLVLIFVAVALSISYCRRKTFFLDLIWLRSMTNECVHSPFNCMLKRNELALVDSHLHLASLFAVKFLLI